MFLFLPTFCTFCSGEFPFAPVYCLAWICLDVLFCTASIMHLCTISVDRYLSLRYPMKFGRNKTRRRVILKIVFVWLLSIAMSLPLSLMHSKVSFIQSLVYSNYYNRLCSNPLVPLLFAFIPHNWMRSYSYFTRTVILSTIFFSMILQKPCIYPLY